jgi:tetratricopeptide (TPR) repeat protein
MKVSGLPALLLATAFAFAPQIAISADAGNWCPEGQQAFSRGKYEEANMALSSCLYNPPDDAALAAKGYYMRGETYLDRDDYDAALSDFDLAVELDPENATAWRSKAWVHYKQNELHSAITAITESLEVDPHNTKSQHIHAQILTAMGRENAAMDAYDLAYSFEDREQVKKLQKALQNQDYLDGAVDGVYGTKTRAALRACIANGCSLTL